MTGHDANQYMGKIYRYHVPNSGIEVDVRIDDWKTAYGRDLFLIVPVSGAGSAWVSLSSLHPFTMKGGK